MPYKICSRKKISLPGALSNKIPLYQSDSIVGQAIALHAAEFNPQHPIWFPKLSGSDS